MNHTFSPSTNFAYGQVLGLALTVTQYWLWGNRKSGGVLLVPYLPWVSFAAGLNFNLGRLSP